MYIKILKLSYDLNNKLKEYQFKIKLVSYNAMDPLFHSRDLFLSAVFSWDKINNMNVYNKVSMKIYLYYKPFVIVLSFKQCSEMKDDISFVFNLL